MHLHTKHNLLTPNAPVGSSIITPLSSRHPTLSIHVCPLTLHSVFTLSFLAHSQVLRKVLMELDDSVLAEFEREVEFMQRTRHANIVRFFGAGAQADGTPFLVEELMAGGSLTGAIRGLPARKLTWKTRYRWATDICKGMAHIHSLGHIHRDLKSGNVLITAQGCAKVADFGSVGELLRRGGAAQPGGAPRLPAAGHSAPTSFMAKLFRSRRRDASLSSHTGATATNPLWASSEAVQMELTVAVGTPL